MRVYRVPFVASLFCLAFFAGSIGAQEAAPAVKGPWLGTWKLNVEKSNYQSGKPAADTVRTIAMTATGPDTFDIVIDSKTPSTNQSMHMEVRGGKFDGKDYVETGNPIADANRFKILNERAYEIVETRKGVEVIRVTAEVSADGKTRTSQQKSMGSDGKPMVNVAVWERVQ